eukprot:9413534-Pyramimonas_sp.AAC.1
MCIRDSPSSPRPRPRPPLPPSPPPPPPRHPPPEEVGGERARALSEASLLDVCFDSWSPDRLVSYCHLGAPMCGCSS